MKQCSGWVDASSGQKIIFEYRLILQVANALVNVFMLRQFLPLYSTFSWASLIIVIKCWDRVLLPVGCLAMS